MNEGISVEEACSARALTPESFDRLCNPDGSVKEQAPTTTFMLHGDPSKSVTFKNKDLETGLILGVAFIVIIVIIVAIRKLLRKRHGFAGTTNKIK